MTRSAHGRIDIAGGRSLAGLPLPRAADGRLILAMDVSNWLRPGAATSPDRLFCLIYGPRTQLRAKAAQPSGHRNPASPAPDDAHQGRRNRRPATRYDVGNDQEGNPRSRPSENTQVRWQAQRAALHVADDM